MNWVRRGQDAVRTVQTEWRSEQLVKQLSLDDGMQ
jgi:hypothetical protein